MSKTIHDKNYKVIVDSLKQVRIDMGLSQQEVANRLSKPQSYVSKIESRERRLDVVELKSFARIYGKTAGYFLD